MNQWNQLRTAAPARRASRVLALIAGLIALLGTARASAQVYDAAADFSITNNPNGVWSYGYTASLGSTFNLLTHPAQQPWGVHEWLVPPGVLPAVTINPTAAPISAFDSTWQPGQMTFHPGPNNERAVVRWTAPAGAIMDVSTEFRALGGVGASKDIHVLHNSVSIYDAMLFETGNIESASLQVAVMPGDTIDFAVGFGNDSYVGDTTSLVAILTVLNGPPTCAVDPGSNVANPDGSYTATVGEPFTAVFLGSDDDADDTLTVSGNIPSGAVLSPPDGSSGDAPYPAIFTWTPADADAAGSPHNVEVSFTDAAGEVSMCSLQIVVVPAPDTDGDGLTDSQELATDCLDPQNPDTDGDGLGDAQEFNGTTDPCDADTDDDCVNDGEDPTPTVPGVTHAYLLARLWQLRTEIWALDLSLFVSPGLYTPAQRRFILFVAADTARWHVQYAGNLSSPYQRAWFYYLARLALEHVIRPRIDGLPTPQSDFMPPSPQRDALRAEIDCLRNLLLLPVVP